MFEIFLKYFFELFLQKTQLKTLRIMKHEVLLLLK